MLTMTRLSHWLPCPDTPRRGPRPIWPRELGLWQPIGQGVARSSCRTAKGPELVLCFDIAAYTLGKAVRGVGMHLGYLS